MRLFVSYSRRDGIVTTETLQTLDAHLRDVCTPFIHCLHDSGSNWEQIRVLHTLLASHAVLLVESPAATTSGWVRLELFITRLLGRPLLRLQASDLVASASETDSRLQLIQPAATTCFAGAHILET